MLQKNIDHKQDFELEMRRKRAAYGKPKAQYKPGRYSRVSAGDITMGLTGKEKRRGTRRVSQQPEDMFWISILVTGGFLTAQRQKGLTHLTVYTNGW